MTSTLLLHLPAVCKITSNPLTDFKLLLLVWSRRLNRVALHLRVPLLAQLLQCHVNLRATPMLLLLHCRPAQAWCAVPRSA
jgi:hypothetical protein